MNEQSDQEFVKITVLESNIEAQVVDSILSEQGIPHRMQSYHDTAFDGLFQVQKGWGVVFAPLSQKKEIIEIIDTIRSQNQELEIFDDE